MSELAVTLASAWGVTTYAIVWAGFVFEWPWEKTAIVWGFLTIGVSAFIFALTGL